MPALGALRGLKAISEWAERDDWSPWAGAAMREHIGKAVEDAGLPPEKLEEMLGEDAVSLAMASALEDLATWRGGTGDRNLVDDLLARRGWKEMAPVRRYLAATRDSVMSLYRIEEVEPDSHVIARDLLRGGEPVRLEDREVTHNADEGDAMAARVTHLPSAGNRFGLAMLVYSPDAAEALQPLCLAPEILTTAIGAPLDVRWPAVRDKDGDAALEDLLTFAAPVFTRHWILDRMGVFGGEDG